MSEGEKDRKREIERDRERDILTDRRRRRERVIEREG